MHIPLLTRIPWDRVNWTTSVFLAVINTLALTAVPLYLWHYGLDWFQFGLFLFYYMATGFSITLGYHRLFSHLSFKARTPVKLATLLFGACAFENSAIDWSSDHRKHHNHDIRAHMGTHRIDGSRQDASEGRQCRATRVRQGHQAWNIDTQGLHNRCVLRRSAKLRAQ